MLVDVGNHLQLAQRIKEAAGRTLEYLPNLEYGRFTQAEFYGQVLEMGDMRPVTDAVRPAIRSD